MVRGRLGQCGIFQLFSRCQPNWFLLCHMELAFGQCAGFIHNYDLCMRQRFQIVAALYQNAVFGSTADSAKEAQRNRDNKCTWAGNDQECQSTINPVLPYYGTAAQNQRWQHGQNHSSNYNARRIVPGKPCDKLLRLRLAGCRLFHQFHNFRSGGLCCRLCYHQFHCTTQVDAAAAYLISCRGSNRHGFSGQRRSINGRVSLIYLCIQRNLFSRPNQDVFSNLYFVYQYGLRLAIP